jgi:hypothetical protein
MERSSWGLVGVLAHILAVDVRHNLAFALEEVFICLVFVFDQRRMCSIRCHA